MHKNLASVFTNILIGFIICDSAAQPITATRQIFYYNNVWELTTPEKSTYHREALFDLVNAEFDGIYRDYDKNNRLIADGIYNHGERSGIHTTYNNDFSVKSKIEYAGIDFTIWELPDDDKNKEVKNGTGKFSIPYYFLFEDGTRAIWKAGILEGEFTNGKKTGYWIYFDGINQPTPSDIETYKNGKLIVRKHYVSGNSVESKEQKIIFLSLPMLTAESLIHDKETFTNLNQYFEKYIVYPDNFNREISFPGGLKRLLSQLARLSNIPEDFLEVLRVKVDEHGLVQKISVVRSVDANIDDIAVRAFSIYDKRVLPAIKNTKPQPSVIYIPIGGGARWEMALKEFPNEWFYNSKNFLD